jgi:hypothetical protein
MAGRIWLKFCGSAQEGWQSVLHKKNQKKNDFENLQFFRDFFFTFFFFSERICGITLKCRTTCSPRRNPQKRGFCVL